VPDEPDPPVQFVMKDARAGKVPARSESTETGWPDRSDLLDNDDRINEKKRKNK
jgi:hypothetical protein